MKGFQKLSNAEQPIALNIPAPDGETVYVRFEPPLLFNFGSNLQQFNPIIRNVFSKSMRKENAASMKALLGNTLGAPNIAKSKQKTENNFDPKSIDWNKKEKYDEEKKAFENSLVGKFLGSNASAEDKKIVAQLAYQIADIWQSKAYETNASNPYAIQSRLALLTYKLGLSTTLNCKSGKDRTGVANVEINHLALEIAAHNGIVPDPYVLNDCEKLNLSEMVTKSGVNHVTRACTGLAGMKIVLSKRLGFTSIKERMGNVIGASKEAQD
jgi:hypothetical protein